jgi:hypothetical protein
MELIETVEIATQASLLNIGKYGSDVVYTPDNVAAAIVAHFKPTGTILDPCAGDGVFLRHLPPTAEWCEIENGRDFFQWTKPVDWLIGNPPYAVFSDWLRHSFKIAEHICYLIPVNKVFNSSTMLKSIAEWGGIREIYVLGRGDRLMLATVGFAVGAVHLQRDFRGGIEMSFSPLYR